jgi:CHAT domain-containing protein/Tfp pilus assembly protein PilF
MERKGLFCLLFLALAGPGVVRAAEEPALLQVGVPVTRELHDGEVHLYRLPMQAGDYARVEIVQQGIDVAVVVRSPAGAVLEEVDSPTGRYFTEIASFVAGTGGEHAIEVKPFSADAPGSYRLILVELRSAGEKDRLRIEAEAADRAAGGYVFLGGKEGLERAQLAVERWRALNDPEGEARALTRLGMIQGASGQDREALATCEQALAKQRPLGDRDGMAESLYQIGRSSRMLGERERTFAAFEEAIALWQDKPDRVAKVLLQLGDAEESSDHPDAAIAAYDRALTLSRQIVYPNVEAYALNNLGALHLSLGQPRQALDELRAALALAQTLPLRTIETDVRTNLGSLYGKLGQLQEAIEQLAVAREILRDSGDTLKQCEVLANLGGLLFQLGSPEEGREMLLQGLPLCQDPRKRALVLLGLSRTEEQLGLSQEAGTRLEEALQLQRSVSDSSGEAETLKARGLLLLQAGEPAQARERLLQSVALFERLGLRSGAIAARRALARAEADLGHLDEARRGFAEALAQAEDLDDVGEQALVQAEAGRLEHLAGRLQEARPRLESALSLLESFRSRIGGDRLRAQQFAKVRETYERYVDVLMQLDRAKPDPGLVERAFQTAERSRARGLLDVLARARVDTHDGDPRLREEERRLRGELNAKAAIRFDLPPGPRNDELRGEIQALSADYRIVEARLSTSSSYAGLTRPPLTVPEIQGLLDDGTALVEYLLAEPRSYVWVVTQGSFTARELPGRSQIEALAQQVHQALSDPSERDAAAQRRALDLFSRQVLAPVLDGLGANRLAIVADGALQYVPFAALPVSSAPGAPLLIAGHETVLLPSAAVLQEIRRVEAARPRSPLSIAIFADPLYRGSKPTPPDPLQTLPATLRGTGLERLSWSRREAEQIAAEAAGHEVLNALGSLATRELATSDRLSHFRIVHFATHGFLDSDHPELSGLALSEVDKDGKPLDGLLLLQDLYSLHLQADLVVLSGCETGLGRDLRGEGFLGLTHGFLHAGASQVIASLWPVRDRAAAELMQRLYHAMLRDGMRPSAALRAAQLEMQSQRTWRDAYFWAAFVTQGDWFAGSDTADRTDTPATR